MKVNGIDTNSKTKKILKVAAGITAIGTAAVLNKKIKGIDIDTFVKKGGTFEDGIALVKKGNGKVKKFSGKLINVWKDGYDKTTHKITFKNGEMQKATFNAREKGRFLMDDVLTAFKHKNKKTLVKKSNGLAINSSAKNFAKMGDEVMKDNHATTEFLTKPEEIAPHINGLIDGFSELVKEAQNAIQG